MNGTPPLKVWVVDDDSAVRWVLEKALHAAGIGTRMFERAESFFEALRDSRPDVLITDVRMPGIDGLELMRRLIALGQNLPVIVITAHTDLDNAVAAYSGGAFEYLPKPFDVDEAVALVRRAARSVGPAATSMTEPPPVLPQMIGQAPAMQEVFRTIGRLARASMNVLITGESGTGKELVARALHQHSPRAALPFVALNTTAISADLLESELFGHERGAFTGADSRRIGRFEQAHTGTLFLDEIGDMSPALQTRLLRVLAEGEFYRVGGNQPIKVDVRVIAATNQDVDAAVRDGRFREDLYHRLNVIRIETPPLRARREDIELLLQHYLRDAARELKSDPKAIAAEALVVLQRFDWPGNVRQLVNVCRRLTVTAPGAEIQVADIPAELGGPAARAGATPDWSASLARWADRELEQGKDKPLLDTAQPEFERTLIRTALARVGGHRQDAARALGWGRNTLTRKMRELGMD
ncbi:MAG: nitrogen regulation protein NR(I) [Gammaproteobacteria bacterium]|nr:nitrogen regulation protein NR(I) [Gammaproteobacteria bacterium]